MSLNRQPPPPKDMYDFLHVDFCIQHLHTSITSFHTGSGDCTIRLVFSRYLGRYVRIHGPNDCLSAMFCEMHERSVNQTT